MKTPVVVHAIRGYLSPTETFVGNQIMRLRRYVPAIVAHHRSPNREFDLEPMYVMEDHAAGVGGVAGRMAYKLFRTLTRDEAARVSAWASAFNPALLHCHYAVDAAYFLPLFRQLGLPGVVSLYGYDVSSFPNAFGGIGKLYMKKVFAEMDLFLAMSEDMKADAMALGAPEEKVLVHYHGINAARFAYQERTYGERERFTILCVGSLEPKKGQHHLLRAVAHLRRHSPRVPVHVVLVGTGPLQAELNKLIAGYDLHTCVEMAGYVPHLDSRFPLFYRNADVFVHFSTTQPDNDKEGIPGTIVEAMASGLPVIATRHAGIPAVIDDGTHGILLDESDTEGIARAILALYESESLRRRLGVNAAQRALTELDLTTKTALLEEIYDRVLSLPVRQRRQSAGRVYV